MVINKLKILLRDIIPTKFQVLVKYSFNRFSSALEPEMELLKYFVEKGDCVIDVGGNRGIYAYSFWKLGAKVEVFEPNINCFGVLSAWAIGKKDTNVYHVALSNNTGSAFLHVPVDESGVEHDSSGSVESMESVSVLDQKVELRELDSFHFEGVKFIKIDVEGHEASVIEGAKETIGFWKPSLLVEIEQRHRDKPILEIFNQIFDLGYEGFYLRDGKLVSIKEFLLERDQNPNNLGGRDQEYINNFIFIHEDNIGAFKKPSLFSE